MAISPEFSRPLSIEGIMPDKVRQESVEATAEECAALAKRLDLKALSNLKCRLSVLRVSEGHMIRVEGDIQADVVQTCVVSLQEVPSEVRAHFDTCFTEEGKEAPDEEEDINVELDAELPDVMHGGILDMGELVAQYLSVELDPYPRAPGVSLAAQLTTSGVDVKNHPFSVLQALKRDDEE